MAPRDGFEPPTNGLTVRRSTTELPGNSEEARIVGKGAVQVKDVKPAVLVSYDGMRHIRRLELLKLGLGQVQREGGKRIVEMLGLGGEGGHPAAPRPQLKTGGPWTPRVR